MGNYLKNLLAAASHTTLPTLGGAALGGSLGYLLSDKDNSNTNALVGAILGGGLGLGGSSAIKSLSEKAQGIADDGLASLVKNFDTTANGMHEEVNQLIRQLSDGAAGTSEKLKASMDGIAESLLASAQNSHDMSDIYGKISKSALIGTLPTAIIAKYLNTRPKESVPADIIVKESSYKRDKMNQFEQDIITRKGGEHVSLSPKVNKMEKLAEQFQNDVITRYQEKMAELMEKDAVSGGKWLGAYGKRLKDILSGTNYGKAGNDMLDASSILNTDINGGLPSDGARGLAALVGSTEPIVKALYNSSRPDQSIARWL